MGAVQRQTPRAMPTEAAVQAVADQLQTRFLVAGSRGDTAAKNPDFSVHGQFRVRGGDLAGLARRKVVLFVHGYNVTTREGLQHNQAFFSRLEASLQRDGRPLDDYGFLGFTWPGTSFPEDERRTASEP